MPRYMHVIAESGQGASVDRTHNFIVLTQKQSPEARKAVCEQHDGDENHCEKFVVY